MLEYREHIKNNNVDGIKEILNQGCDPSSDKNLAFRLACEGNRLEIVKVLLQDERVDPSADDNFVIRWSSMSNKIEIVKLLLQDSRVKIQDINKKSTEFNKILKINREIKLEKLLQHGNK